MTAAQASAIRAPSARGPTPPAPPPRPSTAPPASAVSARSRPGRRCRHRQREIAHPVQHREQVQQRAGDGHADPAGHEQGREDRPGTALEGRLEPVGGADGEGAQQPGDEKRLACPHQPAWRPGVRRRRPQAADDVAASRPPPAASAIHPAPSSTRESKAAPAARSATPASQAVRERRARRSRGCGRRVWVEPTDRRCAACPRWRCPASPPGPARGARPAGCRAATRCRAPSRSPPARRAPGSRRTRSTSAPPTALVAASVVSCQREAANSARVAAMARPPVLRQRRDRVDDHGH